MQTIGGKTSSSTGTGTSSGTTNVSVSSHEIGEVMQVPSNFVSDTWVDAGSFIDKATYPDLYAKLSDGAYGNQWTTGADLPPVSASELVGYGALNYVIHGSKVIMAMKGGNFVSSTDGISFSFVGKIPDENIVPNSILFTSISLFYSNGSTIIAGFKAFGSIYLYKSKDDGATWTRMHSVPLETALLTSVYYLPNFRDIVFDGTSYVFLNVAAKTVLRSTDLENWTETPYTSTMLSTGYLVWAANPVNGSITVINNQKTYFSTDSGGTWTETALAITGSSLTNIVRNPVDGKLYFSYWYSSGSTYYQLMMASADGKTFTQVASLASSAANIGTMVVHGTYLVLCGNAFTINSKAYYAQQATPNTWIATATLSIPNTANFLYSFGGNLCFPGNGNSGYSKVNYMTTPAATAYSQGTVSYNLLNTSPTPTGKIATNGSVAIALLNSQTDYLYTVDGVNWQHGIFPYSGTWSDIQWDWIGQQFYLVSSSAINGNNKNYLTTTDGVNWTLCTGAFPCTSTYLLISKLYVAFCMAGSSGNELIVRDGVHSSFELAQSVAANTIFTTPLYDGTYHLVIPSSTSGTLLLISDPGITSYAYSRTITSQSAGMLMAKSSTVTAFVNGATCYYTADSTYQSWSTVTLPVNATWGAFIVLNDTLILIPKNGTLGLMSKDGLLWTSFKMAGLPSNLTVMNALVFNSMLVLIASGDTRFYVSDTSKSSKRMIQFSSPGINGLKNVVKAK